MGNGLAVLVLLIKPVLKLADQNMTLHKSSGNDRFNWLEREALQLLYSVSCLLYSICAL
jgi:hypothetical protein